MSNANGFKAQFRMTPGGSWNTALTGTEHSCFLKKTELEKRYNNVRVVDADGRVVG